VNTSPIASTSFIVVCLWRLRRGQILRTSRWWFTHALGGTLSMIEEPGTVLRQNAVFTLRSDDKGDNWEYWSTIDMILQHYQLYEPCMMRMDMAIWFFWLRVQHRPLRQDNLWLTWSDDNALPGSLQREHHSGGTRRTSCSLRMEGCFRIQLPRQREFGIRVVFSRME